MSEPEVMDRISAYPELLAVGILIVGLIAARLLSIAFGAGLSALDRRLSRLTTSDASALTPRLIALSRAFVFWITLILAVAIALRVLGAGDFSAGVYAAVLDFVPDALIAFAIVVAGHLVGVLARNLVAELSDSLAPDSPGPRILHGVIIGIAVVMALQYVGVNITFITRLLFVIIATGGGGLMLAFALGARRHVANLLAHRELARINVGERIRIDDVEGVVVEIHDTAVDVTTKHGVATVPAARFAESTVLRLSED